MEQPFDAGMAPWVPHRGEMSLLDGVEQVEGDTLVARAIVPDDGLFVRDGGVPAWVGIEYMAQAVAAWSGARARAAGGSPRIGFLLGTRRFDAHVERFDAGTALRIVVRCEMAGDNGLGLFDCRLESSGRTLATARLSVFEPAVDDAGAPGAEGTVATPVTQE